MVSQSDGAVAAAPDQARPRAVQAAAPPLFCSASPEWMLDASVPIEVRTLVFVLYALAFNEAVEAHDSLKTFGTTAVSVATNYDELRASTGWNRTRLAEIIRAAEAMRILQLTGHKRTGMRYHILVALRSYRAGAPTETQTPLFAGNYSVRRTEPNPQLGLGESFSPAAGLKPEPPAPPRRNPRAALPNEVRGQLLDLGRKVEPSLEPDNLIFETAIEEIMVALESQYGETAVTVLARLCADPRVRKARSPLAYLRGGVGPGGYLVAPASTSTRAVAHSPEGAYDALPPGLQTLLQSAAADGCATPAWCRERDIPPPAAQHARRLVETARDDAEPQPSATEHLPEDLRDAIEAARQLGELSPMLYHQFRATAVEADGETIVLRAHGLLADILQRALPIVTRRLARSVEIVGERRA